MSRNSLRLVSQFRSALLPINHPKAVYVGSIPNSRLGATRHRSRATLIETYYSNFGGQSSPVMFVTVRGLTALSTFGTLVYTCMRAQDLPDNELIRIVTFWMGFPMTLVPWLFVREGSCRAFGVDLPTNVRRE